MLESMRIALKDQLRSNPSTLLFGQDIEDPKGDVFGLTRGLAKRIPEQVRNSLTCGKYYTWSCNRMGATGNRAIAFMQFADFLPVAYNHLLSEIGAMY